MGISNTPQKKFILKKKENGLTLNEFIEFISRCKQRGIQI
jgi:hypothetical protein